MGVFSLIREVLGVSQLFLGESRDEVKVGMSETRETKPVF